jgi:hypothetical protein
MAQAWRVLRSDGGKVQIKRCIEGAGEAWEGEAATMTQKQVRLYSERATGPVSQE